MARARSSAQMNAACSSSTTYGITPNTCSESRKRERRREGEKERRREGEKERRREGEKERRLERRASVGGSGCVHEEGWERASRTARLARGASGVRSRPKSFPASPASQSHATHATKWTGHLRQTGSSKTSSSFLCMSTLTCLGFLLRFIGDLAKPARLLKALLKWVYLILRVPLLAGFKGELKRS